MNLIEKHIPKTFYAGLSSEGRLKMLVEHWQRAIKVNQELETKLSSQLENQVEPVACGKWISVDDELPLPMKKVLVALENGWNILIGYYRYTEQEWACFYSDGTNLATINKVNHWMPLPSKPSV